MKSYEKLGAFYLGRGYDVESGRPTDEDLLYDAKDLTTHGVVVGMTGSGKTGLSIALLEEAAIDGVPALAIDPKGDLGNLLLAFPDLAPEDFRPWIDEGEAGRNGLTPDDYAKRVAETWRNGLASWGQDGERVARLKNAVEMTVYTPGSTSGVPLSVLRRFDAPPPKLLEDTDALRERILSATSGLLTLLGIDPDPIKSREHILVSRILDGAWREGRGLDIASLIREIQAPPFEQVGVLDLESFYPTKERLELAMSLNNLLASPGFSAWMEGAPLSIPDLLWTKEGKPKVSVLYIAHLSEAERMFFVTLLLNEVVAWMRTQSGTSSLRALLYMDEVFGYFPPTANPPSKTPMLTLLKQARAYGLGVVLATQNPVDLDYKGLSNAGTWFLGRLQTERDKARVLDGLEGASAAGGGGFDRKRTEAILSGLKSRVFLMNNVHEDEPKLFHTRWVMSYLRGPLTREQIRALQRSKPVTAPQRPVAAARTAPPQSPSPNAAHPDSDGGERPMVPPGIDERFLPVSASVPDAAEILYRPAIFGSARLHFVKAARDVDEWRDVTLLATVADDVPADPWDAASAVDGDPDDLETEPLAGARFAPLPAAATQEKRYKVVEKSLKNNLYRDSKLTLRRCKALKLVSEPGESEGHFRVRLTQAAREKRDLAVEKLRRRYAPKLARMQERIRKAEAGVEKEKSQLGQQTMQTAISVGATLLGALFGRKVASVGTVGRATTAARGAGRIGREKRDIARAEENLETLQQRLADLEEEFEEEVTQLQDEHDPDNLEVDTLEIKPRKADIQVTVLALAWTPWRTGTGGVAEPAFD